MSGFSETSMRERLQKLNTSPNSIQTLSLWLIHHHRKHADVILTTWLKEMRAYQSGTSSERLIALVYLANDVIQNCRKKSPPFMNRFLEVLQPAFSHISQETDQRCRQVAERVLSIWKDRHIYPSEELKSLAKCLGMTTSGEKQESSDSSPTTSSGAAESTTPPPVSQEDEEDNDEEQSTSSENANSQKLKAEFKNFAKLTANLVTVLRKMEDPASADAKIRQLIASYPESVANPAHLTHLKSMDTARGLMEKIDQANPVVVAYCARLKSELQDRRTAQNLLDDYLLALKASSKRNKKLITSVNRKIARIDQEKIEMAKHLESLPDLTAELGENASSQLPSLGELFEAGANK